MRSLKRIKFNRILLLASLAALTGVAAARDLPVSAPSQVGMSDERLERISRAIEVRVENKEIAGAVAIVLRNGEISYFEAFGHAEVDEDEAMETDSRA